MPIRPRPESQYVKKLLQELTLKEVMQTPAITIPVDVVFSDVVRLFNNHRIRHLPVVNESKEVVGLISQRDLYKTQSPRKLEDGSWYYDPQELDMVKISSVMTRQPFTLREEQTVADALKPMVRFKYGCIPVVNAQNKIVGIITQYDILRMAADILNR